MKVEKSDCVVISREIVSRIVRLQNKYRLFINNLLCIFFSIVLGISMHKGYAFVQFTNPFDARSACLGEDGRTVLGQILGICALFTLFYRAVNFI